MFDFRLNAIRFGHDMSFEVLYNYISLFKLVKELEKYVFYPVSRAFKISCTIHTPHGTQRLF